MDTNHSLFSEELYQEIFDAVHSTLKNSTREQLINFVTCDLVAASDEYVASHQSSDS